MLTRWLHYIDNEGLHSYRSSSGAMHIQGHFPANEEGIIAFTHWLSKHAGGLHALLVDLPDEGFQFENIPFVRGPDRKALIQRRLTQHFFGSPYTATVSLGRENSGRRDERVLFTAATRPQAIEPWLKIFRTYEVSIASLYIVPLLTRQFLQALPGKESRGLIITFSPSGIRQIYFDDKALRFSRLSPPPDTALSSWGTDCLREAQKSYQYLNAQRWIPRGSVLPVWLVVHSHDKQKLMEHLSSGTGSANLEFHTLEIERLAKHFGIRNTLDSSDSTLLLMRMALREHRMPQLAPAADRRYFRLWQLRLGILAAGALAFVICTALATRYHFDARALHNDTRQASLNASFEMSQYKLLIGRLPDMPASLSTLHNIVTRFDAVSASRATPLAALQTLSHVLDAFPDIEVDAIKWQSTTDSDNLSNAPQNNETVTTSAQTAQNQELLLSAHLPKDTTQNLQAASAYVQKFAATLRTQSGGQVTITKQPFDAASDKTLRSTGSNETQTADFQVQLTLTPGQTHDTE